MNAWLKHFVLNICASISCLYYALVPPQLTKHTEKDIKSLENMSVLDAVRIGFH